MTSKTWVPGTVIDSAWLQDVNDIAYGLPNPSSVAGGPGLIGYSVDNAYAQGTVGARLNNEVWLNDIAFGGASGTGDNTAAMDAAQAYLETIGGGTIKIPPPTPGTFWLMNYVCTASNIVIEGWGGNAENNLDAVAPYSLASPAITFGDDTNVYRYNGVKNLHVIGTDRTSNGTTKLANNAPAAIRLVGGIVNFVAWNSVFYNGVHTVDMVPSATQPVTVVKYIACTFRNDISDSATVRTVYGIRKADPGYLTDIKFIGCKGNGPPSTGSYACEMDGTVTGIASDWTDTYWDIKSDRGFLLKGSTAIHANKLQLDATDGPNVVVVETNQGGDPTRYLVGYFPGIGGQKIRTTVGAYTLPSEADTFSYYHRLLIPFIGGQMYFTPSTDPYNTSTAPYFDTATATGPLQLYNASLRFQTAGKGLELVQTSGGRIGVDTLVAGTKTVANTGITANTRIKLTRNTPGGTLGHLSYSRNPGVGFTITSSSATETSDIEWECTEKV